MQIWLNSFELFFKEWWIKKVWCGWRWCCFLRSCGLTKCDVDEGDKWSGQKWPLPVRWHKKHFHLFPTYITLLNIISYNQENIVRFDLFLHTWYFKNEFIWLIHTFMKTFQDSLLCKMYFLILGYTCRKPRLFPKIR